MSKIKNISILVCFINLLSGCSSYEKTGGNEIRYETPFYTFSCKREADVSIDEIDPEKIAKLVSALSAARKTWSPATDILNNLLNSNEEDKANALMEFVQAINVSPDTKIIDVCLKIINRDED